MELIYCFLKKKIFSKFLVQKILFLALPENFISFYSSQNNLPMIKILVENGADKTKTLLTAIENSAFPIVKFLVHSRADLNSSRPLQKAADIENLEITKFLICSGANVNNVKGRGKTRKYIKNAQKFLHSGLNETLADCGLCGNMVLFSVLQNDIGVENLGATLVMAASCGNHGFISYMICCGADFGNSVELAIKNAKIYNFQETIKILENYKKIL